MPKYQPYPEYKHSEIKGLMDIPVHWSVTQLKRGYVVKLGKMLQSEQKHTTDVLLPYMRASNIQPYGLELSNTNEMWFSQGELKTLKLTAGDLLVSEGGDVGRCTLWAGELPECGYQNAINRVRGINGNNTTYLKYLIQTMKSSGVIDVICNKLSIAHFTAEKLQALVIPLPPPVEQCAIATFIDLQSNNIDTLIQKKTRFIALLKEKRQALISHAVTKGLDASVPMKDSGIEWLGEMPKHWFTERLKYSLKIQNSKSPIESNSLLIALENIESGTGRLIQTDAEYSGDAVDFIPRDILFGKLRPYLSKVFYADNKGLAFGDILVFRAQQNHYSRFFFYLLISERFIDLVDGSTYGAKMPRANPEFIKNIGLPIPDEDEQRQIVDYLDSQTHKIESLIDKTQQSIELLKEHRTALISAAVTGKIDVRNHAGRTTLHKELA